MAKKKKAAAKKTASKATKKAKPAAKKSSSAQASTMPSWKIGQVCHTELNTTDLSGAENFYKKLFGWKITAMDVPGFGKYLMIGTGKDSFGGIGPQPDPDAPPGWLTYFYVKSVDAAAKQAESMGGKIMMPATDIGPGMGRIAVVSDPQGAVFGLYTM